MTVVSPIPTNQTTIVSATGNIIVDPNIPDNVTPLDVDLLRYKPSLPPLDYTNLDFSSIKLQLLRANTAKLGYSVRDFADSNTAGMMMNLMAYMGQMLSYHMDSVVNELFLDTAQSSYATFRLLNMFKYKPTRPQQGVVMLNVTRARSTNQDSVTAALEDSQAITFSSSLNRQSIKFGSETFELFPAILVDGVYTPDYLGDLIIPAYQTLPAPDPDSDIIEADLNTYTCFALSGTTKVENFISNGTANQIIYLSYGPILNSNVIVQVQDLSINIPGMYGYNTWDELNYLALAGFTSATTVGATQNLNSPYLIAPYKLSAASMQLKQNSALPVGTLMELDYDQTANVANYTDFINLNVPYRVGIVANITSQLVSDSNYVDLLLYHPNYVYGGNGTNEYTGIDILPVTVNDTYGNKIGWTAGDILYLLVSKPISSNLISTEKTLYQPQIISDTQILQADYSLYPDIQFLKNNPQYKIAVGKALSSTVIALGISADVDTYYSAQQVYEVGWDGNFNGSIRFGDDQFGAIPANNAAIQVVYRINSTNSYGYIVGAREANQIITATGTKVSLTLNNQFSSSPSSVGESIDTAKELCSRFFVAQDRAVSPDDYVTLSKRFNSAYKIAATLVKSDADGCIIRLFALNAVDTDASDSNTIQPLTVTEKYLFRNYLNSYKCVGVDVEIADGTVRLLYIRIDARLKAGYLSGQVKSDLTTAANNYFSLSNFEMGQGLSETDFVQALLRVSGVNSLDLYMGGYSNAYLPDGTQVAAGVKTYKQLKSIPGYNQDLNSFPSVVSDYDVIFGQESTMAAYEILVLGTLTVNVLS
jgi:hypothetical protein